MEPIYDKVESFLKDKETCFIKKKDSILRGK